MTDVITVNRGSRMATHLRWSTKNIISRSQSQRIKTTPKYWWIVFVIRAHVTHAVKLVGQCEDVCGACVLFDLFLLSE